MGHPVDRANLCSVDRRCQGHPESALFEMAVAVAEEASIVAAMVLARLCEVGGHGGDLHGLEVVRAAIVNSPRATMSTAKKVEASATRQKASVMPSLSAPAMMLGPIAKKTTPKIAAVRLVPSVFCSDTVDCLRAREVANDGVDDTTIDHELLAGDVAGVRR